MKLHPLVKKILFNYDQINKRTEELAKEIDTYYAKNIPAQNTLITVGILKGCVPFMGLFLRYFETQCETHYMVVSSFLGKTKASGQPKILLDLDVSIKGKDVLIIEDIIDSGITLEYVIRYLFFKGAKSIKIVTLLDKPENRQVDLQANWTGFSIENEFVIGFGFDYEDRLRNLPYIAVCDINKLADWSWDKNS